MATENELSTLSSLRDLEVTRKQLTDLVVVLRASGWRFVPLSEMVIGENNSRSLSLTFDDGYLDNLEVASPILEQLKVPYTVFITTGFIDRTLEAWWISASQIITDAIHRHSNLIDSHLLKSPDHAFSLMASQINPSRIYSHSELNEIFARFISSKIHSRTERETDKKTSVFMDWAQVRELAQRKLCTLGCHTETHRSLGCLKKTEVRQEMANSRRQVEQQTGLPVHHFSYPHGRPIDIPSFGERLLRDIGFHAGFSTSSRNLRKIDRSSPWALPRKSLGYNEMKSRVFLDLVSGSFE